MARARKHGSQRHPRRRRILAILGVLGLGVVVFVLLYFEPYKAFIDDEVHETIPGLAEVLVTAAPITDASATEAPIASASSDTGAVPNTSVSTSVAPPASAEGTTATTPGVAATERAPANSLSASVAAATSTGQPVVVSMAEFFSGEHTTKGLALVVALPDGSVVVRFEDLDTSNGPDLRVIVSPDEASDAWKYGGRVHLGELKGNIGDQNYTIKPDVDLTQFNSVVIWCERFSVAFGAAAIDVVA